jgi:hypothetical protein
LVSAPMMKAASAVCRPRTGRKGMSRQIVFASAARAQPC